MTKDQAPKKLQTPNPKICVSLGDARPALASFARGCPPCPDEDWESTTKKPRNKADDSFDFVRLKVDFWVTRFFMRNRLRAKRLERKALKNGPPASASARVFPGELFFAGGQRSRRRLRLPQRLWRTEKSFGGRAVVPPTPKLWRAGSCQDNRKDRIAWCVSEGEPPSEPSPNQSEPEPSGGSALLGFARDCSALLAFPRGSFFCGAETKTTQGIQAPQRTRKLSLGIVKSDGFCRFPSLSVASCGKSFFQARHGE